MKNPAIIVVAYNRLKSLERILKSIQTAVYNSSDIPLIISIDKGGPKEVLDLANSFEWSYGSKEIRLSAEHLGLKAHILQCMLLANQYESIIVLEDDLLVSPYFYTYTLSAIEKFGSVSAIAGIALYSYMVAESCYKRFIVPTDGFDNYFMQVPCSWGQCWTANQINDFIEWLEVDGEFKESLPSYVSPWPDSSWKKLFFQYVIDRDKLFVYPRVSLSTNFADKGTHFPESMNLYQTPLLSKPIKFNFISIDKSPNIYDSYFEMNADCFQRYWSKTEVAIALDLYGLKPAEHIKEEKVYTSKSVTIAESTFGIPLQPLMNNLLYQISGKEIKLAYRHDVIYAFEKYDLVLANAVSNAYKAPFNYLQSFKLTLQNSKIRLKLILKKAFRV